MYYLWITPETGNPYMLKRLYPSQRHAILTAVILRRDGNAIDVRNAATGELVDR